MSDKPKEISAKNKGGKMKPAFKVKKPIRRDPRFDRRCGGFSGRAFEQNYGFVYEAKKRELRTVEKQLARVKEPERKQQLQELQHSLVQQELRRLERSKADANRDFLRQKQAELSEAVGHKVYMRKDLTKKLELVQKFKELKKSGKLKAYMERKRKLLAKNNPDFV